jgi:hypothetical protein
MGLRKNMKDFDLFGIETHLIPPNPHGLCFEVNPCEALFG